MMAYFKTAADGRETEIGSLLEKFLDDNAGNLPPVMFDELNDIAGIIDEMAAELISNISDAETENKDLTQRIEELEGMINQ